MHHINTDKTCRQYELPKYDFRRMEEKWQHSREKNNFDRLGIETLRFYTLGMLPDKNFEWHNDGIREASRYMGWIWIIGTKHVEMVLAAVHSSCSPQISGKRDYLLFSKLNKTITTADKEIDAYYFHTVARGVRELSAVLHDYLIANDPNEELVGTVIINLIKMLSIFCPFLCEELWQQFGYENSIFEHPWPSIVNEAPKREKLSIPVRINGMLQQVLQVPADTARDDALLTAYVLEHPVIKLRLDDREISKVSTAPDNEIDIIAG